MLTATLTISGSPTAVPVLRVDGEEALGHGFRYEVDASFATAPATATTIGAAALLMLSEDGGGSVVGHPLSAVVSACTALGTISLPDGSQRSLWRLRLEPALARWEHDRANSVAGPASPLDAAKGLLKDALADGFYAGFLDAHKNEHAGRQHLVRWQESTAAFATRLLEEEGVHSFYVHMGPGSTTEKGATVGSLGRHVLVLSEDNQRTGDKEGENKGLGNPEAAVEDKPCRRLWRWQEVVAEAADSVQEQDRDAARFGDDGKSFSSCLGSKATTLDRASVGLGAAPTDDKRQRLDLHAPGGGALAKDGGDLLGTAPAKDAADTRAKIGDLLVARRAQEALCRAQRCHGRGDHLGVGAGTVLTREGRKHLVVRRRLRVLPALTVPDPAAPPVPAVPDADTGAILRDLSRRLGDAAAQQARLARDQIEARYTAAATPELDAIDELRQRSGAGWDGQGLWVQVEVEAIPLTLRYRPPRTRHAPVLAGVHFATVKSSDATAGAGAVRSDKLGRVQVAFDWAADQLSGWMRVAQGARGLVALPRVGERVAVQFAYGDPGRPLVAAVVFDQASDLPGDPSETEAGRTVIGGRFANTTGHLDTGKQTTCPTLGRAPLYTVTDSGGARLVDGTTNADLARGAYLAFEDQTGTRGIDLFSAGAMREQVNGKRTISVGDELVINAGKSITLQVGQATLKLSPTGALLSLNNSVLPAMGPSISLTPIGITMVAPVYEATGYLRAKVASSCSAFTAQGPYAKVNGFSASLNSDLFTCLGDLATSMMVGFSALNPAFKDERSSEMKSADIIYAWTKEGVLAGMDLAKMAFKCGAMMKSPADVIGTGLIDATAGSTTMRASPFPTKGALNVVKNVFKFSTIALKVGGGVAGDWKNDSSSIAKMTMGSGATLVATISGVLDIVDMFLPPPALNKVAVGSISGVAITATKKNLLSMTSEVATLSDKVDAATEKKNKLQGEVLAANQKQNELMMDYLFGDGKYKALMHQMDLVSKKEKALTKADDALQQTSTALTTAQKALGTQIQSALTQVG